MGRGITGYTADLLLGKKQLDALIANLNFTSVKFLANLCAGVMIHRYSQEYPGTEESKELASILEDPSYNPAEMQALARNLVTLHEASPNRTIHSALAPWLWGRSTDDGSWWMDMYRDMLHTAAEDPDMLPTIMEYGVKLLEEDDYARHTASTPKP